MEAAITRQWWGGEQLTEIVAGALVVTFGRDGTVEWHGDDGERWGVARGVRTDGGLDKDRRAGVGSNGVGRSGGCSGRCKKEQQANSQENSVKWRCQGEW